jgi:hypothetical protein
VTILPNPSKKVRKTLSSVLDPAGLCLRSGAPAPQIQGWGAGGVVRDGSNDATAALPEKVGRIAILPPCNRTNRSHEGCGEEWKCGDVVWLGLRLDD